jgi:hypothetical protein
MTTTAVEPRTVAREATVPTTTDKAAAPDDLWGKDWANESQPSGRPGNGRGRAELPALRTLAERRRKPSGKPSHPVLLITGENHSGKAQPLHSLIATPTGWTTMGELEVGDRVIGSDGRTTRVTAVHDRGERHIYRLTFNDGATVEACDEHLWASWNTNALHRVHNRGPRKGQSSRRAAKVRTTAEIRELVLAGERIYIPVAAPVEYDQASPLPIDAYLLGLLLGDGCFRSPGTYTTFTSGDPELLDALSRALPAGDSAALIQNGRANCVGIRGSVGTWGSAVGRYLRGCGLGEAGSAEKFIPAEYMTASVADRLALLQGLLDTDGGMEGVGITFTSVSPRMAGQVQALVRSLGGTCSMRTKLPSYRTAEGEQRAGKTAYRLSIRVPAPMCPFRLTRKVQRWTETRSTSRSNPVRRIVRSVDYVGRMPARCITVEAADHLYVTDGFVVTHNSFEAARLTGDERIGGSYWLQVGRETTADEYGAVDGARYEIIGHDGSWRDMYAALEQSHGEAHQLVKADDYDGRPPLLVVDSMTGVWEHLSRWAESRALLANSNVVKLLQDPHADIDIGALLWNAANRRHKAWMTLCLTWPGPVVLLARGKMSMAVNERTGNLDHKAPKVYTVNAQKDLPFEVTMHLRLDVKEHPEILGYRHPKYGIGGKAGGKSVVVDPRSERFQGVQFSLAWTLFNALRYDPATAVVRAVNDPDPVTDTDVQNLPAARRLTPDEAAKLAGADEAPGQEPAAETEPRATR